MGKRVSKISRPSLKSLAHGDKTNLSASPDIQHTASKANILSIIHTDAPHYVHVIIILT